MYVVSQSSCCTTDYINRYGKWAVITGSTDGIGLAIAHELARRGHSIVVMGRSTEKLNDVKASIETEPNVGEVITVRADLSDQSPENFDRIKTEIDPDNREIGILINNAGFFPSECKILQRFEMEGLRSVINLNSVAPVYMAHMILPGMAKRGKGLVVNVSSIYGVSGAGYLGVYSATKSFLNAFSKQLQTEYSPLGVDVINLIPGPIYTRPFKALNKNEQAAMIVPSPESFARSVINAVSTRYSSFCGCAFHEFLYMGSNCADCMGLHAPILRASFAYAAKNYAPKP